jgi:4-hydroxy-tetrahydrodipicolinate synthase
MPYSVETLEDGVTPSLPTMFSMVVTPMDRAGIIDEDAFRAHLRRMVAARVGVYLGSGGTGQGHALDRDELSQIYQIGVSECKGRIPVYCNPPESRTAKEMLWKCHLAVDADVDLVQIYQLDSGHGRIPTAREQELYFRDVLDGISHPVALSIHRSSGYFASVELVAKLCGEYPQVKAVNLHGPNLLYFVRLQDRLGPGVKIYGGMPTLLSMLPLGGWGCQAAEPNLVPNLARSIIDRFLEGKAQEMGDAYKSLLRLWAALEPAQAESQDATKAVLRVLGLPGGYPRPPRAPVAEATLQRVRQSLEALGIWELEGVSGPSDGSGR